LQREQLEVHFQPIVALDDEAIVGMEALVRWEHPRHGLLPPAAFLPLAEETGLIVPLGRLVLRSACHSLRRWQRTQRRHRNLYVSVNLGAQEINAPGLARDVKTILDDTGLDPSSLILEVTEGVLLATDDQMMTQLRMLKRLGVRLAIDDFGTGYSALNYLQRFPMDIIKIDKTFVDDLGDNAEQDRLVRGIIELAHGLDLETVAEGIERAEQATVLRTMHAELGQGFHFAKPLSSADMDAILSPVPLADVAAGTRARVLAE
jgi:EAL domain-containing protein (putative c-di-GMP-specific phosphodiesterase class I)